MKITGKGKKNQAFHVTIPAMSGDNFGKPCFFAANPSVRNEGKLRKTVQFILNIGNRTGKSCR